MKKEDPKIKMQRMAKLVNGQYRVSRRGVPLVTVTKWVSESERYLLSICYFGKNDFYKIFEKIYEKGNAKLADIKTEDEVVEFIKQQVNG